MALGIKTRTCAFAALLAAFNASAAMYEIQPTGISGNLYISEVQAFGQFDSLGILPAGAQIKSASVLFSFQDEADGTEYLHGNSHPEFSDVWVEQPPVYSGYDIHYPHVRDYYRINESLWRFERETVSILLGGLSMGTVTPSTTSTINSSKTPGPLEWDHGGSSDYVYAFDSEGKPLIWGTRYYDYYNQITYVDEARYIGNEVDFSLDGILDTSLFALLESGGMLDFTLDVTRGDLLFMSAALFIETFDEGAVPEPSTLMLALLGVAGASFFSRRTGRPIREIERL